MPTFEESRMNVVAVFADITKQESSSELREHRSEVMANYVFGVQGHNVVNAK